MAINFAVQEKPGTAQRVVWILLCVLATCAAHLLFQRLGPLGAMLNLSVGAPCAYLAMRVGMAGASVAMASSAVVLYLLSGAVQGVVYPLQFGVASLLLPWLLCSGMDWFKSVVLCLLISSGLVAALAVGYAGYQQSSVSTLVASYVESEVTSARQIYEQAGLTPEQLRELMAVLDNVAVFFQQAYVGIIMLACALLLLVTVWLLNVAARGCYTVPGVMFHNFRLPEWLVWLLISAGFGMLIKFDALRWLSLNLLTVLLPWYFLQGAAILTFFFRKKAFSMLSRVFGYTMILVINPLPLLVTAIGVFDLWFDFRKPRVKTT